MMGQLATSVQNLAVNIEKGRFPSQPLPNPKGVHGVGTSQSNQQEEAKLIMTLRKGKLFDIKVEVPIRKTSDVSSSGQGTTQDSSSKDLEESNPPAYIPKAPFPQRLAKPKQGSATNDIMEIFRQVSICWKRGDFGITEIKDSLLAVVEKQPISGIPDIREN
ncbi:hypothetical protein TIFTF001_020418 [Ficus carica]|uniref:Uncharacterized protein n=1 Tax=Ficus carica TaxID=3494 RepID=A0AA88D9T0_FICCA|nr:hypothetical protein TIFTF001_020418 [Ficus carica]